MLKAKYLAGMLSAHTTGLHNYPMRLLILLCGDKCISTLKPVPTSISIEMIKHHSDSEQALNRAMDNQTER